MPYADRTLSEAKQNAFFYLRAFGYELDHPITSQVNSAPTLGELCRRLARLDDTDIGSWKHLLGIEERRG